MNADAIARGRCGGCRHYDHGTCRRYPPVTLERTIPDGYGGHFFQLECHFPEVSETHGCGEFAPVTQIERHPEAR